MLGATNIPVERASAGSWQGGRWQEGDRAAGTILAAVQPAKQRDYDQLQALAEGRRLGAVVRVYTTSELNVAGADAGNGDVITWRGKRYRITAVSPWQTDSPLNHFRYLAVQEAETTGGAA
jgi:hypothetical protein